MYQNKVSLIGFLGGDAEVRNANDRSFTTLSLATKSSYKEKKSGQCVTQTEPGQTLTLTPTVLAINDMGVLS